MVVGRGLVGEIPELVSEPSALGEQSAAIDYIVNAEQFGRVLPDAVFDRLQEQNSQIRTIVRNYDSQQRTAFMAGYAFVKEAVNALASNPHAYVPASRNIAHSVTPEKV